MRLLLVVVLSSSFFFVYPNASLACICKVRSVSQRKKESRMVFLGKVIERTEQSEGGTSVWRNKFTIERYWKGDKVDEITVYTGRDDCASWFELGREYLVFAYFDRERNRLETDSCMGTGRIEMVAKDLQKLGNSKLAVANK